MEGAVAPYQIKVEFGYEADGWVWGRFRHMRTRRWAPAVAMLAFLLAGCGPSAPVAAPSTSSTSGGPAVSPSTSATPDPTTTTSPSAPTKPATRTTTARPPVAGTGHAPTTSFAVGSRQLNLSRGSRPLRTLV